MKKAAFIFLYSCLLHSLFAQKTSGDFYIFKKDGSPAATMKEAAFLLHGFQLDSNTYVSRYYNFKGPMIRQESFTDSTLATPNGRFC